MRCAASFQLGVLTCEPVPAPLYDASTGRSASGAGVEMTAIKDLEDLKEYVSHGITWEEFNEQQERERVARERKEERLRRIREMRRLKAEREAKQVEENEYEWVLERAVATRAGRTGMISRVWCGWCVGGAGTRSGATA